MKTETTFIITFIFICAIENSLTSTIPLTTFNQTVSSSDKPDLTIIDLSQDKSDDVVIPQLRDSIINGILNEYLNQYFPSAGDTRALQSVANFYSKAYNIELKYNENVLISAGASEGLYSSLRALTNPGDEWIIIEPFWPVFTGLVETAGGVPRYVALKPLDAKDALNSHNWVLNRTELKHLFNKKTKGIIFNNPHNPTGKIFTLDELQFIADLSKKHNTYILADHVFEWIVYKPRNFINIATLPSMFNRTIAIGSASKSFLVSGWRIGWVYGPKHLMDKIKSVHAPIMVSSPTLMQSAIAEGLERELKYFNTSKSFFHQNSEAMEEKRDLTMKMFTNSKMKPVMTHGGDCMIVHMPKTKTIDFDFLKNITQLEWFTNSSRIKGYPMTSYYSKQNKNLGKGSMRFCYQKKWDTLKKVEANLLKFVDNHLR